MAESNLHKECISMIDGLNIPRGRVLDLGAGEGAFSARLIERGFDVTAVELMPSRFQLSIPCHHLDLNKDIHCAFTEKFDLIVAIEIIEHLENPRHFIKQCLSLLHGSGYLLVTSPNVESWMSRIRYLRDGRLFWFSEPDYTNMGHITPIFSWQIEQICREQKATVFRTTHTKDRLLWSKLGYRWNKSGYSFVAAIKNKISYLAILYPLMVGRKKGEINIYLIKFTSGGEPRGSE